MIKISLIFVREKLSNWFKKKAKQMSIVQMLGFLLFCNRQRLYYEKIRRKIRDVYFTN